FQAEDGIRDFHVTGVQTCALPISAAAAETFGFDAAYSIEEFDEKLIELMANQPSLYYAIGHDAGWDARITRALNGVRAQTRAGKIGRASCRERMWNGV